MFSSSKFALLVLLVVTFVTNAFNMGGIRSNGKHMDLDMVKVGEPAPDFTLASADGKSVKLSSFKKKSNVVLFFYPADNSPGCTKEVCAFDKRAPDFKGKAAVFGISSGGVEDKLKFTKATKLSTATRLLIDDKNEARTAFNVPKAVFGLLAGRVTYVIGKDGVVKGIYDDIAKAEMHPDEALKVLSSL
jgi:thioredoxin-dependent peroxiredoxin